MSQEDKLVWKILKSARLLPSNESGSDSDDETISKFDFVNNFLRYKASFKRFKVSAEEVFNILNDLEKKLSIVDVDGVKSVAENQSQNEVELIKKDFISELPLELKMILMKFTGPLGYFKCIRLSKTWHQTLSTSNFESSSGLKRKVVSNLLKTYCF